MKRNLYRQCELRKNTVTRIAWIPSRYAKLRHSIRIRENDTWSSGWYVTSVYAEVEERCLPDSHSEIKGHRKRTGDAATRPK